MATAEQLRALVRSHFSEDPERFYTTALQVAAYGAQRLADSDHAMQPSTH